MYGFASEVPETAGPFKPLDNLHSQSRMGMEYSAAGMQRLWMRVFCTIKSYREKEFICC